jgi:hypothetical protein
MKQREIPRITVVDTACTNSVGKPEGRDCLEDVVANRMDNIKVNVDMNNEPVTVAERSKA